jgi:indolepyruvate ferredoxin oxidoreductase
MTRRLLSGVETLGELLLARRALDERDGLDTATFVSGYPGSPLGTFDRAPGRLGDRLAATLPGGWALSVWEAGERR